MKTKQTEEQTKVTIMVKKEIWESFKKKCKENESDASKEIRKFIKQYLKQ